MFLGGWMAPFDFAPFTWVPGWLWLGLKTFCVVSLFIWFRATFPRYRYDQIMRLGRSEEHTSELQSLMRISYAVFCLKKKTTIKHQTYRINKIYIKVTDD